MAYIYNLTDTWNAGGTTFAGIKMVVTNTASGASSKLLDLSVSGATTGSFSVDKSGNTSVSGALTLGTALSVDNGGTGLTSLTAGRIPFGAGTSALGNSANLFWDSANNRLGLATSGPASRLTLFVTPGSNASDGIQLGDGSRTALFQITGTPYNYIGIGPNETVLYINGGPLTFAADGQPIKFCAGTAERMRVTAAGAVLIGTTTAGASKLTVADSSIQINTAKTPASATDTGTTGQVCWDSSYIYVCTATNTWKRAAIATW
jgi:hypothetical protein